MEIRRSRIALQTTLGLALAVCLAAGVELQAGSGGFFCCYGSCSIVWDCELNNEEWNRDTDVPNLGPGECRITAYVPCNNHCDAYVDITEPWLYYLLDEGYSGMCPEPVPEDGQLWTWYFKSYQVN